MSKAQNAALGITVADIEKVLEAVKELQNEFPHEWDIDDLDQESLEVALDDVVITFIDRKLLKRRFSTSRTFSSAFAALFGESAPIVKIAKRLELSTSEYSNEFSAQAAKNALEELLETLDAMRKAKVNHG